MIETFICEQCGAEFTMECADDDEECWKQLNRYRETYPVCADCQHSYLAWSGAHAAL